MAVTNAIKGNRLVACVLRDAAGHVTGISDFALADREWEENTDLTKAPTSVKVAAAARSDGSSEPSDLMSANTRKAHWDAELKELKFKEAAGELVPRADVEQEWIAVLSAVRTRLLGVPSKIKGLIPALTVADVATVTQAVREALTDICDEEAGRE